MGGAGISVSCGRLTSIAAVVVALCMAGPFRADAEFLIDSNLWAKFGVDLSALDTDPVSMATGEFIYSRTLFDASGPAGIGVGLTYSSQSGGGAFQNNQMRFAADLAPGGLPDGFNWSQRVFLRRGRTFEGQRQAMVCPGSCRRIVFAWRGGWQVDSRERWRYELKETADFFYFLDPENQHVTIFEKRDGPAYAIQTVDRNGNALTYVNGPHVRVSGPASVADGLGRSLHFSYGTVGGVDTNLHLTRIEDQTGQHWDFAYEYDPPDNPGLVTLRSITDPLGGETVFQYTGCGRNWIAGVTLPRGNTPYTQTYDPVRSNVTGVVRSQTDAFGNTWEIREERFAQEWGDVSGNTMFSLINPDGTKRSFAHDNDGTVLNRIVNEDGQRRDFATRSGKAQSEGVTDPEGRSLSLAYEEASGEVTALTNGRDFSFRHLYTQQTQRFDNPVAAEDVTFTFRVLAATLFPDNTVETYARDARGNVTQRVDRAGAVWTMEYNSRGQRTRVVNPVGGAITFVYNADGTLSQRVDPELGTTTFAYDAVKRPTRVTHPDGTGTHTSYDALDRVTSTTDERTNTTMFAYDANGNVTHITDAQGQTTHMTYDALDRVVSSRDRLGNVRIRTYDARGNRASTRDPTGVRREFGYDVAGRRTSVTLGAHTWRLLRDAAGQPVGSVTPLGHKSHTGLDAIAYPESATDALGNRSSTTRDPMNALSSQTDPVGNRTLYGHDARSLLAGVSYPGRGASVYARDDAGRLTAITDLRGQTWAVSNSPLGRLLAVTDPLGQRAEYKYDARDRVALVTFADGSSVSNVYDAAGNRTRRLYSDGADLTYAYDDLNRLVAANGIAMNYDAEGRPTSTVTHGRAHTASYDAAGRLRTVSYNGGTVSVTYVYDYRGLLVGVSDDLTGTRLDFSYDDDLRLTGVLRNNGVDTFYAWDAAARLTRIRHGAIIDLRYTRDAAGRIIGTDITAPLLPEDHMSDARESLAHDAASQLKGGYGYDALGRLINSPTHRFTWDGASQLVRVSDASHASDLTYTALGDRATRTANGAATLYHYNAALPDHPILAEQDQASGAFKRYCVWSPDGRLLYAIEGGGTAVRHYHFDQAGSTLALTDGGGAVTDSYAYDAFGRLLAHNGASDQPFTFAGRFGVRVEQGALYHMKARYYDARTARFLSREPLWPQLANARKLNPYQYAQANPVNRVDVTGTDDVPVRVDGTQPAGMGELFTAPLPFGGPVANPACPAGKVVMKHAWKVDVWRVGPGKRKPKLQDFNNMGDAWGQLFRILALNMLEVRLMPNGGPYDKDEYRYNNRELFLTSVPNMGDVYAKRAHLQEKFDNLERRLEKNTGMSRDKYHRLSDKERRAALGYGGWMRAEDIEADMGFVTEMMEQVDDVGRQIILEHDMYLDEKAPVILEW